MGEWAQQGLNLRPLPCEWGSAVSDGFPSVGTRSHPADNTGRPQSPISHTLAPSGTVTTAHGAPVVRTGGLRAQLRAVRGGADHLLTIRDVATRLGVSTATVYALCDRGELAHVRISNAIRVAPTDLAAFVEQLKGGR